MDRIERLKRLADRPDGPDWNGHSYGRPARETLLDLGDGYVMQRRAGCVPVILFGGGRKGGKTAALELASQVTRETLASHLPGDQAGMKTASFDAGKRGV